MEKKIPLRMCLVCRKMLPKQELIRVVRQKDGTFLVDTTGKAPGRGAYVCKDSACVSKLKAKRFLNKSFKTAVPEEIYEGIGIPAED